MQLRPLRPEDFPIVHATFLEAFSDYAVPFQLTSAQLAEMLLRRGYEPAASIGVFDEDRLVAFTLNGLGEWNGVTTGYDTGTGVTPSHRGRGLSGRMIEASIEVLQARGARQYLLEVLQSNERAFHIYRDAGFEITRELQCWQLEPVDGSRSPRVSRVEELSEADWEGVASFFDAMPSWQNTIDAVRRAAAPRTIHVALDAGRLIGVAVAFDGGDLPFLGVARDARRRGVGRELLAAATTVGARRAINVDSSVTSAGSFLERFGAARTVSQFEMLRRI